MPRCADIVIQEALDQVENAEHEMMLDFAAVPRIHAAELQLLRALAAKASERSVRVVVHGANVELYKVLKLTALVGELSFA